MQQVDPDLLSCVDYLVASSEYFDFLGLMLDFKVSLAKDLTNYSGSQHVAIAVITILILI